MLAAKAKTPLLKSESDHKILIGREVSLEDFHLRKSMILIHVLQNCYLIKENGVSYILKSSKNFTQFIFWQKLSVNPFLKMVKLKLLL